MATAVGSIVSPTVSSADLAYGQGRVFGIDEPIFGKISAYAAPNATILWSNGVLQATVPNTVFDEIIDPTGSTDLLGKKVRVAGQNVALDMVVVQIYRRAPGAGGGTPFDAALCRCLSLGIFREFAVGDLEAA